MLKTWEKDILEELGWWYDESDDGYVEIGQGSPAGEDFFFTVSNEDVTDAVYEYAYNGFDVDEHVELWVEGRGRNGVPGTIRELVDDAEEIQEMLKELSDALMEEWRKRQ